MRISPYVLQYLIPNGVWLNLFDVWPEELRVPFIDVPTIFCDMDSNLKEMYEDMSSNFDRLVLENQGAREDRILIYTLCILKLEFQLWIIHLDTP